VRLNGLKSGVDGLKIIMMCELPTNALLADEYLDHFDGNVDRLERHDSADVGIGFAIRRLWRRRSTSATRL